MYVFCDLRGKLLSLINRNQIMLADVAVPPHPIIHRLYPTYMLNFYSYVYTNLYTHTLQSDPALDIGWMWLHRYGYMHAHVHAYTNTRALRTYITHENNAHAL